MAKKTVKSDFEDIKVEEEFDFDENEFDDIDEADVKRGKRLRDFQCLPLKRPMEESASPSRETTKAIHKQHPQQTQQKRNRKRHRKRHRKFWN